MSNTVKLSHEENQSQGLGRAKPQYATNANSKHRSIEQRLQDIKEAEMACAGLSRFEGAPLPSRR